MHPYPCRTLFVTLALAAAPAAHAVDGTITINGEITSQTCKINGNLPPHNFIVALPKISASALKALNATAGATVFVLNISDCPSELSGQIKAYFEPGPTTDYDKALLYAYKGSPATVAATSIPDRSSAEKAQNVSFQIANIDGSPIKLGAPLAEQGASGQTLVNGSDRSTKAATLRYLVRYIKSGTGDISANKLVSYVQYSLVYP